MIEEAAILYFISIKQHTYTSILTLKVVMLLSYIVMVDIIILSKVTATIILVSLTSVHKCLFSSLLLENM